MNIDRKNIEYNLGDKFDRFNFSKMIFTGESADETYSHCNISSKYIIPNNQEIDAEIYQKLTKIIINQLFKQIFNAIIIESESQSQIYSDEKELEYIINNMEFDNIDYFVNDDSDSSIDVDKIIEIAGKTLYKYDSIDITMPDNTAILLNYNEKITIIIADLIIEETINNNELLINIIVPFKKIDGDYKKYNIIFIKNY